jgi:hypothetical protein
MLLQGQVLLIHQTDESGNFFFAALACPGVRVCGRAGLFLEGLDALLRFAATAAFLGEPFLQPLSNRAGDEA